MSMNCNVGMLRWTATPGPLTALGAALWRWCNGKTGNNGIYQNLDNQVLSDLIAGKLPASQLPWQAGRLGVNFWVSDEKSSDRPATIARLRREIPARGVEDIVIDGRSWNLIN